eukprot:Hpha_TRINITY_DN16023_c6_g11::TRINITY_DN16023_c6_g11_i1::g.120014::m.120014
MKWQLGEEERARVRACLAAIEYPSSAPIVSPATPASPVPPESATGAARRQREEALLRLHNFLEGDRLLVQGVARSFHATIFPLLYSVLQDCAGESGREEPGLLALTLLGQLAGVCTRKQVSFLLVAERFKAIVGGIDASNRASAVLAARLVDTLLRIEDSVKELFWELNLHQVVRRSLTRMLGELRAASSRDVADLQELKPLQEALLAVLVSSAATSRHRQELYGSGYGLCSSLLQCTVDIAPLEGAAEQEPGRYGRSADMLAEVQECAERLVLACAHLVRENKLNQDSFRQQPNLGLLGATLRDMAAAAPSYEELAEPTAPTVRLQLALDVLSLCLQYNNDGVRRIVLQEAPAAQVAPELHAFQAVLLEGLENLRRHHYDVDVVVRSLRSIEAHLIQTPTFQARKSYIFRNTYGAWSLLCLCLNNIDERIMFQACCLTCTLVRGSPENQCALIDLDGIDTLSEILGDYNLDIQLVGLRILDALKDSGSERMKIEVGNLAIIEHLLRVAKDFPGVFTQIVNAQPHWGGECRADGGQAPLNVTTPLNPNPFDVARLPSLEKQVSILEHSVSLIGDIVVHCPNVRLSLLEMDGITSLLYLLSYSYSYCHAFYASMREAGGGAGMTRKGSAGSAAALLRLPRAQTAPGPRLRPDAQGDAPDASRRDDEGSAGASPIKKLSSLYIKTLLSVVEVTCRALSNVVRQLPQAQWSFHKNGGTESLLQYLHCLLTFTEGGKVNKEHEAWAGCTDESNGAGRSLRFRLSPAVVELLQSEDQEDEQGAPATPTRSGSSSSLPKKERDWKAATTPVCQSGWLVGPELLASILLLAVNVIEANKDLQAALRENRMRVLLHHLLSHPSSVVVNATMLLTSHLCFDNPASQRFFSTPCVVQRLCHLSTTSYVQLVGGLYPAPRDFEAVWRSDHLHLLTHPPDSDPRSFYAFQGLAYSVHCFATLVQQNPSARAAAFAVEVESPQGVTMPWLQLLAFWLAFPCYPVQDAALLLLKNLLHAGPVSEEWKMQLVNLKVVDCLMGLVRMDRPGAEGALMESELKWLSNKGFQLLTRLSDTATQVVMAHISALVDVVPAYRDSLCSASATDALQLPFMVPPETYEGCDDVDAYNALTDFMPILNGLVYGSEESRRICLTSGGPHLLAALCCRRGLDVDLKACAIYALANCTAPCRSVSGADCYALLQSPVLDMIAKVATVHHITPGDDEDPVEHATQLEETRVSLLQLSSTLVMAATAEEGHRPARQMVAQERREVVSLAALCGTADAPRPRDDAISFLLTLAEDDEAAAALMKNAAVAEVFKRVDAEPDQFPRTIILQVRRLLR